MADHATAHRCAASGARLRARLLGPRSCVEARRRSWALARAVDCIMSKHTADEATSAAAPSPFPPIAEYAFLSNCHTGALVAPDGSIDWLCVPRFDSASVFGALLDRQAGAFRLGPFGLNVPSARIYEPGTNTLLTTWHAPTGWMIVRDALTMGPRLEDDVITPHTRPPADEDGDHMLVRTVLCLEGHVDVDL